MPRTYKPKPGAKTYRKYDTIMIQQALQDLKGNSNGIPSITSVAKTYGMPFSVLQRHNQRIMKSQGGQTALAPEAEEYIIRNLNICADWGYPLETIDLRYIVKMYLDSANITVKRFKNNFPGPDFAESFLKRHSDKISKRISQNIKNSRAKVSPEVIKEYFTELEKSLEGVPSSNIVNYDESNLADDPGRQKVIVRRGCKYPERVRNHSKGCVSLMIAANAEGELLPPYVVYKSTSLYDTWTKNGYPGTRYNRSPSGWFDGPIFVDWVETIVIPYFDKKEGTKVLIGDNLSSHLSADLITKCKEKDIHFVFLPPNSTHLTQPLDVAYFRPMKQAWRQLLKEWKKNDGRCLSCVPKGCFPKLLKLLFDQLKPNSEQNIRSGFRKTGIVPLNCQEVVISRLPNETEGLNDATAIDESFVKILKEMRYGTMNVTEPKKKKKLEVVAGKSVDPEKLFARDEKHNQKSFKNKGTGKKIKSQGQQSKDQKMTATPSTSADIMSMPTILEDVIFTQEQVCGEGTGIGKEVNNIIEEVGEIISTGRKTKKLKLKMLSVENHNMENTDKKGETVKNKGIGKKTKTEKPNEQKLIPISLNSPLRLNVQPQSIIIKVNETASASAKIESMPIILAEDIIFTHEEICGEETEIGKEEVNDCSQYNTVTNTLEKDKNLQVITQTNNMNEKVENIISVEGNPKKIKILSDVTVPSSYSMKRKGETLKNSNYKKIKDDSYGNQNVKKITKHSTFAVTANTPPQKTNKGSSNSNNYYNKADEIFTILNESP